MAKNPRHETSPPILPGGWGSPSGKITHKHTEIAEPPECFEPVESAPAAVLDIQRRALDHVRGPIPGVSIDGMDDRVVLEQMSVAIASELTRYVELCCRPGGFLLCMLCGDFEAAEAGAKGTSLAQMPVIAYWIWRYCPAEAFGTPQRVHEWLERGQR